MMRALLAILLLLGLFGVLWALMLWVLPRAGRGVRKLASGITEWSLERWSRLHVIHGRLEPYLPALLIFALGTLVIFWAGDGFVDVVQELQQNSETLRHVDQTVYDSLRSKRSSDLTAFFTFFTIVGTPVVLGLLVGGIAIWLLVLRRYRWAIYLVVTAAIGGLLNSALKHYFVRPRPDLLQALRGAKGTSFPSGHAMGSMIVFGALSYLMMRAAVSWRTASAAVAACITFVLAIALSRVYLGVHWISDIAAGLTIGAVWVALTTTVYEVVRRIRLTRK